MKKAISIGISAMLCGAVSPLAHAQVTTDLDSVIIKGNRIQAAFGKQNSGMQVIDSRQIKALPVKSVNELLSYAAGVDIRQRSVGGSQADISIDGSTFDQVLVLVNGVKVSDPQTGHNMMNIPIAITAIDHIEILRGPAARIYGINALAGAVNIVTKQPVQNEVTGQVYAGSSLATDTATGDTYYGWGAQATASLASKHQRHMLSLAHDEGNGYRYNTSFKADRIFYQNHITINSRNSIDAMGGFINNTFGANGFYSAPKDLDSKETVQTVLGSIAYKYKPSERWSITPRISYRYGNDEYIFIKQNPSYYRNVHETNVVTGEIQSTVKLGDGILGAGVEYRSEEINSTNLGKRNRENIGIYAEYKYYFSDRFNAGAGVYGNYNSDYGGQLFPGLDAGYRVAKNWKLFVNTSTGSRLPTYTDLYYKGPTNIGNANLNPEQAYYAEAGVQWRTSVLFFQANYFFRRTNDFIDWVRPTVTDAWQPQNFQSINVQGYTLSANYQLSEHAGLSDNYNMILSANYTYLQPVVENPTAEISKYAVEALRHQLTASLRSLFYKHIQLNLNAHYLYRINANDYTIADVRVGYQQQHWMLYADVNNVFDTQYREISTVQMPGRWYTLGLKLNTTWK